MSHFEWLKDVLSIKSAVHLDLEIAKSQLLLEVRVESLQE